MLDLLKKKVNELIDRLSKEEITPEKIDNIFEDIEFDLLESNISLEAIEIIKERLKEKVSGKKISRVFTKKEIKKLLEEVISDILLEGNFEEIVNKVKEKKPVVILLIGINGVGKTTIAGKLAYLLKNLGYNVVFSASDTFRAASIEQLEEIGRKLGIKVIKHKYGADPAAVAFDAVNFAKARGIDFVIIDSAGRLHTDKNLMEELKKIKRVVKPDYTILLIDALTGNDAVNQAKDFLEVGYDYIIITKFDLDEKGGTAISVSAVSKKPIIFLSTGQGFDDIVPFKKEMILNLLSITR